MFCNLKGVRTQIFLKHIECCNFQNITVIYIKVYISGMEMSQRIFFWLSNFTKNDDFFEKMAKNNFSGDKKNDKLTKIAFELKIPKFLENHVKTLV